VLHEAARVLEKWRSSPVVFQLPNDEVAPFPVGDEPDVPDRRLTLPVWALMYCQPEVGWRILFLTIQLLGR